MWSIYSEITSCFEPITKIIIGIATFFLTLFFSYRKIGDSIGCKVTISLDRVRGTYIKNIIFQNHKDKPIFIIKIFGIQENIKFYIEELDIPIIIKSLESLVFKPSDYSYFDFKGAPFILNMGPDNGPQIYIETPEKVILCKPILRPSKDINKYHLNLRHANKITNKYNNHVYYENTRFAAVYLNINTERTVFVDSFGFIDDDVEYLGFFKIPGEQLTAATITAYLKIKTGFDFFVTEV